VGPNIAATLIHRHHSPLGPTTTVTEHLWRPPAGARHLRPGGAEEHRHSQPVEAKVIKPSTAAARRLIDLYMDTITSDGTRRAYRRNLNRWVDWCEAQNADPLDARKTHVLLWLAELDHDGDSTATRAQMLSAASNWYEWLLSEGQIAQNPTKIDRRKRPKVNKHHSDTIGLSLTQARELQQLADDDSTSTSSSSSSSAIVAVLLQCALRISELGNASIEDLTMDRGHQVLRIVGKGNQPEWVTMPPAVMERIRTHLAERDEAPPEQLPALQSAGRPPRPLVVTPAGRPVTDFRPDHLLFCPQDFASPTRDSNHNTTPLTASERISCAQQSGG
jgi:site-specific recombinase XerD